MPSLGPLDVVGCICLCSLSSLGDCRGDCRGDCTLIQTTCCSWGFSPSGFSRGRSKRRSLMQSGFLAGLQRAAMAGSSLALRFSPWPAALTP